MKKIFVNLVLVLSPFAMGLYAQCDSLKDVVVSWDKYPVMTDPTKWGNLELDPDPPTPFDTSEKRRIYFVHGLGGNATAWSKAALACEVGASGFPARKCETIRADYTSNTSTLYDAASAVRNGIGNQADIDRTRGILDPSRAIVIAHSQGGVVMRELMHLDMVQPGSSGTGHSTLYAGMNYGGVVTVSSPLQGAQILNSRDKLLINQFAKDACNKLVEGPTSGNFLELLMTAFGISKSGICNFVGGTVLNTFFNDLRTGVTNEYTIGASTINTLNKDTLNQQYRDFHKMAFYAIEPQNNILWRTANYLINSPNLPEYGYFGANNDWKFYDSTMMEVYNYYTSNYEKYKKLYNESSFSFNWTWFLGPGGAVSALHRRMTAYKEGKEWIETANTQWQFIIGAIEIEWHGLFPIAKMKPENDGVVLAESAMNLPKATWQPIKIYPNETSTVDVNKGSSHMQVRNDAGIKTALKDLFDGKLEPWFFVAEDGQ